MVKVESFAGNGHAEWQNDWGQNHGVKIILTEIIPTDAFTGHDSATEFSHVAQEHSPPARSLQTAVGKLAFAKLL